MAAMTDPGPGDLEALAADVEALAADLRPQAYGRTRANRIEQPVVEPLWFGVRVIVAGSADQVTIYDEGEPVPGQARIEARLARMLAHTANGVILDGYLTKQATSDELPAVMVSTTIPSAGQLASKVFIGIRRDRHKERIARLEAEAAAQDLTDDAVVNLVLTDLLWLDGEWLLDVPLLERKRLLEAIIPGDDIVRAGPYVQPPYGTWIGSWRSQGFVGLTFKEANSRYAPGEIAADWATSDLPRR
jgi:ATP dependent DNA ligase domain